MKKLLMFVFVALIALGSCFAQPRGGDPALRLQREIDGLKTALTLTDEQLAKVTTIVTEAQKKQSEAFAKMRESGDVDREKVMAERAKSQAETDKLIKAVITADQATKLDAYRKKVAEERAARMQDR